jgi:hypothetical protein
MKLQAENPNNQPGGYEMKYQQTYEDYVLYRQIDGGRIATREQWTEAQAIEGFTPVSICTTPGQLGSSEMCKTCTAPCAGPDMAADIDPVELELIRSGAIS